MICEKNTVQHLVTIRCFLLYLKDVIFLGAFLWPVSMTEMITVVLESGQHDNDDATLFPDHLPEIGNGLT